MVGVDLTPAYVEAARRQAVEEQLDDIILDMIDQSVEPWVCLCYGNPIYPGGGGTGNTRES